MSRNSGSSVSGLVIVLTLPVNEREGLRPYLSQSEYPAKGTTVGGRTDDPRRERTRDAPARHRARAGARQRQPGVPRTGDLPDGVLSLAQTLGTLRGRRRAPAPAARPGRPVATAPEVERLVLGIAISAATWGRRRIAAYLARTWRGRLAPRTLQRLLRRVGLAPRRGPPARAGQPGAPHARPAAGPHPPTPRPPRLRRPPHRDPKEPGGAR